MMSLMALKRWNGSFARYSAIEDAYLGREDIDLKVKCRESMASLYARILDFQAPAVCHFSSKHIIPCQGTIKLMADKSGRKGRCARTSRLLTVIAIVFEIKARYMVNS